MKEIGGYFELECKGSNNYHSDAIMLNSGRNALEYILIAKKIKKIFLPFYTCEVLLEAIRRQSVQFEFYSIDHNFEPLFDFGKINDTAFFLYTNYFGLKDEFIENLSKSCKNLVIDNAQSFFSNSIPGVDTFYSPRKFFGVSDGAYLYCTENINIEFEQDYSYDRMKHLLIRSDDSAQNGYDQFCENEKNIENQPIKLMSKLTQRILSSIDYEYIKSKRVENFTFLHQHLKLRNKLVIPINTIQVPYFYPLWLKKNSVKKKLIENKIYIPAFWKSVAFYAPQGSLEIDLYENLLPLPIDHRYGLTEMKKIISLIDE